jgi:hypothetical protein
MVVAVNDESDSLESNKNRLLIDLPYDCQMNGCKWFLEREKKDLFNIFFSIARIISIRPNGY